MRRARRILILAAAAALSACARPMAIETDPRSLAAVQVSNQVGVAMLVYYEAGAEPRLLGSVPAGGSERFIVTAPAGTTVRITARSETGQRTAGPYTVTLQSGTTQQVVLR
jgi:hypothetical protein